MTGCVSIKSNKNAIGNLDDFESTSAFYQSLISGNQSKTALLDLFFTQMPKGGDIHHHYSGTIYAETYLEWVEKQKWFIDIDTFNIVKKNENNNNKLLTVPQLLSNNTLYRKLLTLWSDKDFFNHYHNQLPPDTHFFNTFGFFDKISNKYMELGFNILKKRAIQENINYIETMLTRTGIKSSNYFDFNQSKKLNKSLRDAESQKEVDQLLDMISIKLLKNKLFNKSIDNFITIIEKNHLGIDDKDFILRFQTYAIRVCEPIQVFTDLFLGYLITDKSPLFVGVNIVAPENNPIALKDYTLHMRMYNYLSRKYPKVDKAIHAGELTLGLVRPKDLNYHIEEACEIAHPQRIGHGVDLPYEKNPLKILKYLKKNAAIEILFSSNEFILGVKNNKHPYILYSRYGVPIVICSDDSGVLRNNLSHEYVLLASRYKPTYSTIKKYVYNSIKHSFLSLDEKRIRNKLLDKQFILFEHKMSLMNK